MFSLQQATILSFTTLAIYEGYSFSFPKFNHQVNPSLAFRYPSSRNLIRNENYYAKCKFSSSFSLTMANDDDDDEDDYEEDVELGDWRKFRMNLAETGIKTPADLKAESTATSSSKNEKDNTSAVEPPSSTKRPKSVSKKNEELLISQNEKLAKEYISGVWAHEIAEPELGGLVCRLPIEAEIWRAKDTNAIGRKLQQKLNLYGDESGDSNTDIEADNSNPPRADENEESQSKVSFSPLAAKTLFWYRGASNLVQSELKNIANLSKLGAVDASSLTPEALELVQIYNDNMDTWQEVCLVINRSSSTKTVTINRPMAFKLNEPLAKLLLFGASSTLGGSVKVSQTENLVKFLTAFENEIAVYVGGPNGQGEPAEVIHGIRDLEGSVEIGEGTGIYRGGISAAINGVLKGLYKPLEFRFFVGSHEYASGELEQKVKLGKYQSIACARSLALKQCIALPKPLWHEVMELCGGELKEMSLLELNKRSDIENEDED